MKTKLLLISLVFLFSSFCFSEDIHQLVYEKNHDAVLDIIKKHKNNPKKLKKLLNSEGYYYNRFNDQSTAFLLVHIAIRNADLKMVKILVENGASVKGRSSSMSPRAAIMEAVLVMGIRERNVSKVIEMIEYLAANGAKVNLLGRYEGGIDTPLPVALLYGYYEIAETLIRLGANVNYRHRINNATPLEYAIKRGNKYSESDLEKIVKTLVENGADIHFSKGENGSLLHTAIRYELIGVISYFISLGIDVNKKDLYGKTPLDRVDGAIEGYAFMDAHRMSEIKKILEKAGAKRAKDLGIKDVIKRSIGKCSNIFAGA